MRGQAPEKRAYCHPDSFPGTPPRLYRNNGDGTFSDVTAAAKLVNPDGKSLAVALADLDGDGWTDVFIANDTQRNFIYFNKGDGTFEDASYSSGAGFSDDGKTEAGMSAGAGDIDGDGDIDLYVSHLDGELNRLYVNEGKRLFTDATITSGLGATTIMNSGFGAQFLDADNDGSRDLVVVNGHILDNIAIYHAGVTHAEVKKLYRNLGGGRFADVTAAQPESFRAPRVGRGLAVGDYDNDGFPDLLVGNNGQEGQLFRNSGAAARHWLGVRLVGTKSVRDGTGARLKLTGGTAREPRPGQGRRELLLLAGPADPVRPRVAGKGGLARDPLAERRASADPRHPGRPVHHRGRGQGDHALPVSRDRTEPLNMPFREFRDMTEQRTETCVGDAEANRLLRREYRKGFVIPDGA